MRKAKEVACPPLFTYLCLIGTARAWESEGGYWQAGRSRVKPELWAPPRDGWRLRKQSSAPVCTSIPVTVAFIELLAVACCRRLSALLSHRTVAKAVPGAKTRDSLPAGGRFPTGGGGALPFSLPLPERWPRLELCPRPQLQASFWLSAFSLPDSISLGYHRSACVGNYKTHVKYFTARKLAAINVTKEPS